ncbi:MAG: hypothetical protein WCT85_05555 [Parachlamydiales bacterium]|jgi:hypothetical protein
MSSSIASTSQLDSIDLLTNYFTAAPRDLFKGFHHLIFWNKQYTGRENHFSKTTLGAFSNVFEAFNLVDFVDNANKLRRYLLGKDIRDIKDAALLLSDTSGSFCDSVSWLSAMMGIISISSYATSWITSVSGSSLMFGFAVRSIEILGDLKNISRADERRVQFLMLVKNVALFAIGVLVFSCGWYSTALSSVKITLCSSAVLISSLAIHFIRSKNY